nr:hypothetical protein BaRGS_007588 [Batillaria attramentaria]
MGIHDCVSNTGISGSIVCRPYSDSHDFLESLVDAVTTSTQVELAKDPGNFVTNHEGENVLTPEVSSDLCNIQYRSVKRYGLQVTTDGSLYGNMLNVTVFDSICQNCTADGCVKLVTCKVQSFYNDRNILSPYVVSDAIDLANSPLYPVITVDLAGPDSGNSMRCSVHTPDTNPTARYKVTCKIRSYYSDINVYSPPVVSNGIDLAIILT